MQISAEHKKKYLERRIDEIEELKLCLDQNNFDVAISIGHRLKGNGETFGFPIISAIGAILEEAGASKNKGLLHETIEKLVTNVEENLKKIH